MRILHFTTHLNRGGISQYIFSVGASLRERGHEIFVASSGGEMEKEFEDAGMKIETFPMRTKSELNPKIYVILPRLMRWLRKNEIHLIHAHTRITQVMASWIERLTGIPFVTTVHGFYKPRLGRRLHPSWGERAIAISEAVATDLQETHRVQPERIRLIYNGLDIKALAHRFAQHDARVVRKEYGFGPRACVMGVVARLVSDKGHEYLIRAMKKLENQIPDLSLLIVGDGRHRDYLEDLARKLGLLPRIRFTGNVRDVSKPLAAIDAFVLPAVWREGFGLSIVEAMACRKPVIVTNIWALNTLIENHVNGILVEPRDVDDLARAIFLILNNADFREQIGRGGEETAKKRFSLDRMVQELESVYREVLPGVK